MQPYVYNIPYYQGDDFSIVVTPKDSSNNPISLSNTDIGFFNVADKRGDSPSVYFSGQATIDQISGDGVYSIVCTMPGAAGSNIKNGYVYDVGFKQNGKRITVVTGQFQVTDKVKEAV